MPVKEKIQNETGDIKYNTVCKRSAAILSATTDAVICTDIEGHITFWNQGAETLYGYSKDEVLHQSIRMLYKNEDIPVLDSMISDLIAREKIDNIEVTCIDKNKKEIKILLSLTTIKNDKGEIQELVGFTKDITELQKMKRLHFESEARFKVLFENSINPIAIYDSEARFRMVNRKSAENLCVSAEEITGRPLGDFFPENQQMTVDRIAKVLRSGEQLQVEDRVLLDDGFHWFLSIFEPVHYQSESLVQVVSYDITNYKKTLEKLNESEERYRLLYQSAGIGVGYYTPDGKVITFNEIALQHMGMPLNEVVGKSVYDLFPKEDADTYIHRINKSLQCCHPIEYEDEVPLKTGNKWFLSIYNCVRDSEDKVLGVQIVSADISKSKQTELYLKKREQFLKAIFEQSLNAIMVADDQGNYKAVNQAAADMFGYTVEQLLKMNIKELKTIEKPGAAERYEAYIKKGKEIGTFDFIRPDGETRLAHYHAVRIEKDFHLSILVDMTDYEKSVRQLTEIKQQFEAFMEHLPGAAYIKNTENKLIYCNSLFASLLGKTPDALIGKKSSDYTPPQLLDAYTRENEHVLTQGETLETEHVFPAENGPSFWITRKFPIHLNDQQTLLGTVSFDITRQKQAEQQIKSQNERLVNIIEGTNLGTWEWNVQTGETVYNEKWANIIGYTLDEISPVSIDTWIKYAHPEDLKKSDALLEKHFRGESDYYHFENRMKHKNGHYVWVLDRGKVVSYTNDGKPLWIFGTHQEITDRKYTEEALQRSESTLSQIVNGSTIATLVIDTDHRIIHWNKACENLTGFTADEMIGTSNHWKVFYQTEREIMADIVISNACEKKLEQYYKGKYRKSQLIDNAYESEDFFPRLGPHGKWLFFTAVPIKNSDGSFLGAIETLQDISERKRAEAALRLSEKRYKKAQEIGHVGNWEYNLKNTHFWGSEEGKRIYGLDSESDEFTEKKIYRCIIDKEPVRQAMIDLLEKEKPYDIEFDILTHDTKQKKTIHSMAVLEKDNAGKPVKISGVLQDITERKHMEAELRKLLDDLELKNAEMERFIYTVSHDLKSPMITIQGFIGVINQEIQKGNIDQIGNLLHYISDATHQMDHLLSDLLELSRIGRVVNVSSTVTMNEIVEEALLLVAGLIKKHDIQMEIQPDMPGITVDKIRIKEVIVNLIENSIKYRSEKENLKIQIGSVNDQGNTVFYVKDNGIGIAKNYHEKIFGLFDQLDPKIEGTGVGLALVKRIIEFHSGEVWVDSEGEDKGATFYFTLGDQ